MKDFFDVALLARAFDFDGELLTRAPRRHRSHSRRRSLRTRQRRPRGPAS
jgi:hypothetical protein